MEHEEVVLTHTEQLSRHETLLELHTTLLNGMAENIRKVSDTMNQIKWIAIGIASAYCLHEFGFLKVLEKVIG